MTSISQQKPRRRHPLGFSIPFLQGGLCPRLVAGYFSLSSHLQMRWQTTPAVTERRKVISVSISQPSLPCRYRSGNTGIIAYFAIYENPKGFSFCVWRKLWKSKELMYPVIKGNRTGKRLKMQGSSLQSCGSRNDTV